MSRTPFPAQCPPALMVRFIEGQTDEQIAAAEGCTPETVRKWRGRWRLTGDARPGVGTAHKRQNGQSSGRDTEYQKRKRREESAARDRRYKGTEHGQAKSLPAARLTVVPIGRFTVMVGPSETPGVFW